MAKTKKVYMNVPGIPTKINEIISYLSMEFSKNCLLERDDLAQDLYIVYLEMIKKDPQVAKKEPGYFFLKFKWHLLTKWRRKVTEINKEWAYKLQNIGDLNYKKAQHTEESTEEREDNFNEMFPNNDEE